MKSSCVYMCVFMFNALRKKKNNAGHVQNTFFSVYKLHIFNHIFNGHRSQGSTY